MGALGDALNRQNLEALGGVWKGRSPADLLPVVQGEETNACRPASIYIAWQSCSSILHEPPRQHVSGL
jgi:hypothetical protein